MDYKQTTYVPEVPDSSQNPSSFTPPPRGGCAIIYNSISRSDYHREDESATDFAHAMALARRGYDEATISYRILVERTDWKNHSGNNRKRKYLDRTVKNALKMVGRI